MSADTGRSGREMSSLHKPDGNLAPTGVCKPQPVAKPHMPPAFVRPRSRNCCLFLKGWGKLYLRHEIITRK